MKRKIPEKPTPKGVRLEEALGWLRKGIPIRRRGWVSGVFIFQVKGKVFLAGVPNPEVTTVRRTTVGGLEADTVRPDPKWAAPIAWKPYPGCVLAGDWEKAP